MKSQPQNPEFRINPENFQPWECFPGLIQYKASMIKYYGQGHILSPSDEAGTGDHLTSSQALYHWVTPLLNPLT